MKTILVFIIVVLSIGCNSLPDNSSFTGNWKLIQSNGTYFNVCPKVKLVEVSRVISSMQPNEGAIFSNDTVVFSHADTTNYFSETEFQYRIITEDGKEFLELLSVDKKNKYLLARDSCCQ